MGFTSDPPWQRDSEPSVIIIADDLSGATDSAVACAERGLDTVVALGKTDGFGAAEAIAFDADTRRLTSDAAAAETARRVRTHAKARGGLLFKKVDSTLRGPSGRKLPRCLTPAGACPVGYRDSERSSSWRQPFRHSDARQ
jgi:hypothetical protein